MTAGKESFEEKRRFPRLKVEVEVEFRIINELGEQKSAAVNKHFETRKTRDLSPLGVCIDSGRFIEPGTIIEVKFKFPGQTSRGIGRVVWSREMDGTILSGIEFLAVANGKIDQFANTVAQYYFEQFAADKSKHLSFLKDIIMKFTPKG